MWRLLNDILCFSLKSKEKEEETRINYERYRSVIINEYNNCKLLLSISHSFCNACMSFLLLLPSLFLSFLSLCSVLFIFFSFFSSIWSWCTGKNRSRRNVFWCQKSSQKPKEVHTIMHATLLYFWHDFDCTLFDITKLAFCMKLLALKYYIICICTGCM